MQHHKLFAAMLSLTLGACAAEQDMLPMDEDQPAPVATAFKLRIENIAPWTVLKSGVQAMRTAGTSGALGPGQAYDVTFTAGRGQKISFASMLGESNDWFFAAGPGGIALYDAQGNPISGDVTSQIKLYDSGTEVDQEPGVGDSVGPNQPALDYGAPDPNPLVRQLGSTVVLSNFSTFTLPPIAQMIKVTLTPGANRQFTLRIENKSTTTTLSTSNGTRDIHISPAVWALHYADSPLYTLGTEDRGHGLELVAESGRSTMLAGVLRELGGSATAVSPGVYAVHQDPAPLYSLGLVDRGQGLERLAEDGNTAILSESMLGIASMGGLMATGVFEVPVSGDQRAAIRPGHAYEISLSGLPGDRVSFVTMFGWSNDWFFGTSPEGIALFDADGTPMTGEVTEHIALYDAGTELDQEPAIGADTGPQQAGPDTGALDPVRIVREVPTSTYPVPASTHLRVTLTPQ